MNPQETVVALEKAQVDDVPLFTRKTPLQLVIQLLKRHRDNWSKNNPDSKPISIIITTLASRAYNGEGDIVTALTNILERMEEFVNPVKPRVPNPVDPDEDFADRWYRTDSSHLMLEKNFFAWLFQAKKDVQHILSADNTEFLCEIVENKFGLRLNQTNLKKHMGISATTASFIERGLGF